MAKGPRYRVPFRRRKQGKTNYKKRKALVQSRIPRLTIRTTKKHLSTQIIKPKTTGDQTITQAHTKQLTKTYGWKAPTGNTPAAYLTGLLCGHKAKTHKIKKAILDIGLQSPTKGARIFATLKGILDSGITIPHSPDILPNEKRIQGQHIADYAKQLSTDPETYQKRFANYISKGLQPEQLPQHFSKVKEKITSLFEKEKKP
jgi:large subunit ribosomal protein L18